MLITVKGLVIGQRSFKDNHLFLDIITEELGIIEVTAYNAKSLKSAHFSSCQLFSYSVFCVKKSKERYVLNSSELKYSFYDLRMDIKKLSLAVYFLDIIKYSATSQSDLNLLRFLAISLYEIEKSVPKWLKTIKSVFELKIMTYLGFMPNLTACNICACYEDDDMFFLYLDANIVCSNCYVDSDMSASLNKSVLHSMRYIVFTKIENVYKFSLSEDNLSELSIITENYIKCHLSKNFKSLDYYYSIL